MSKMIDAIAEARRDIRDGTDRVRRIAKALAALGLFDAASTLDHAIEDFERAFRRIDRANSADLDARLKEAKQGSDALLGAILKGAIRAPGDHTETAS